MQLDSISYCVLLSYGSLTNPRWHFVSERLRENPYADPIDDLQTLFEVVETTDCSADVSRVLCLKYPEADGQVCRLMLSLVGRFAASVDGEEFVLQDKVSNHQIKDHLLRHDIEFLPASFLRETVLFSGKPTSWYNILFSRDSVELR